MTNRIKNIFKLLAKPIVFYMIFGIYYFISAFELTMINSIGMFPKVGQLIRYCIYLYLLLNIFYHIALQNSKMNIKDIGEKIFDFIQTHLFLILYAIVAVGLFVTTRTKFPIVLMLLLVCSHYYNKNKMFRIYLVVSLAAMVITYLAWIFGRIPEVMRLRNEMIRYSYGYVYPLELMTHFLFIVMAYFYVNRRKKVEIKDIVGINIMNLLLFKLTDSKGSCILVVFVSIIALINSSYDLDSLIHRIPNFIYYIFIGACFIVPVILSIKYNTDSKFFVNLNELLSNRLYLQYDAIKQFGISLFGKKIHWIGYGGDVFMEVTDETYNFVDCAYVKFLLDYGAIYYILIAGMLMMSFKHITTMERPFLLIVFMILMMAISTSEPRLLEICSNPFILFYAEGLMVKNKKKNNMNNIILSDTKLIEQKEEEA